MRNHCRLISENPDDPFLIYFSWWSECGSRIQSSLVSYWLELICPVQNWSHETNTHTPVC